MRMTRACAFFALLLATISSAAQAATAPTAPSAEAAPLDGLESHRGGVLMRVTALTDQIIRVRIARDGVLPEDSSWAVPSVIRAHRAAITRLNNGFATGAIRVTVDPASLALTVTDPSGKVIVADSNSPISFAG